MDSRHLLNQILRVKPPEWDNETAYNNMVYKKVEILRGSIEFTRIAREFEVKYPTGNTIHKIQRIQHPFAFAKYELTKKHLSRLCVHPQERTIFIEVSEDCIDTMISFNCDLRRRTTGAKKFVIMAKTLETTYSSIQKRDSNQYPQYLIECTSIIGYGNEELLQDFTEFFNKLRLL